MGSGVQSIMEGATRPKAPQHPSFKIPPIGLKGHTRPLSHVLYNRDNDLLFTCAKDQIPTVWYARNGERIGTYNGHTGACNKLHVNSDSSLLITASADMSARLWDVQTGRQMAVWKHRTPVRAVGINLGDTQVLTVNDPVMTNKPTIFVFDLD